MAGLRGGRRSQVPAVRRLQHGRLVIGLLGIAAEGRYPLDGADVGGRGGVGRAGGDAATST
ncbi:hypothetical protein [Streptomyces atrovirens]|uniref:Uncharacterized protein n=1 Tax=Streptomyces atrovirens TaxID=285556 RepID=A0ABW0E0B1_9ACTN